MKIHVMSDIHLEGVCYEPTSVEADVVVLAGDIGVGVKGVQWAMMSFDLPVVYVAGNHEYHDSAFTMDEHMLMMKQAAQGSNVVVLDNEVTVINEVRFIGATLWTGGNNLLYCDQNIMMDWNEDDGCLDAEKMKEIFEASCDFLKKELARPFKGKTVVVTHHAPSMQSIHEIYANNLQNECYATDVENIMTGADVWVHGHTHNNFDYIIDNTSVVCNPRGYSDCEGSENDGFDERKVVSL